MAKTKKNILIVSQGFWPEVFPINDIAANLSKFNFNIDILTGKPNYPQGKIFKGYKFLGIQQEKFKSNCEKYIVGDKQSPRSSTLHPVETRPSTKLFLTSSLYDL